MKLIALILPILLILVSGAVSAAIIEGNIYDIGLDIANDTRVEIDTTPKQHLVSKDGFYSFNVPVGEYIITAKHDEGIAEEKIKITDDGSYNIDLILFPDFSEEEEILSESDLEIGTDYTDVVEKNYSLYYLIVFVIAIVIIIAVIFHYKKKIETSLKKDIKELKETHKKEDIQSDLKELVDFIKKEGGRTTQKDIRKHFPQSEAKISLMVSELEHKGQIKKIKKGRGNIITLR